MNKKCIVMFSGGLDSRLALKIMQQQKFNILAVFFKLPFNGCCDETSSLNFLKKEKIKFKVFDCTKGKLLKEYIQTIRRAKNGRGVGVNPCVDCRIFMLKKTKKLADSKKIELIVTGEVLGERPMSQMKKSINLVEEKSGLKGRLLRPLSAKLLSETKYEKENIVNREELYKIQGRKRTEQMNLAKKFKINYPTPAGGCLLCEKMLKKRFMFLIKRKFNKKEVQLSKIGRHFIINGCWIVLGRNEKENKIINKIRFSHKKIVPKSPGPSAIFLDKHNKEILNKVNDLILAYSKKGRLKERKKFEKYKL